MISKNMTATAASIINMRTSFPGPIVRDTEGIISAVRQAQSVFDSAKIENFRNYFMDACDGHSTARIAEAFMEK